MSSAVRSRSRTRVAAASAKREAVSPAARTAASPRSTRTRSTSRVRRAVALSPSGIADAFVTAEMVPSPLPLPVVAALRPRSSLPLALSASPSPSPLTSIDWELTKLERDLGHVHLSDDQYISDISVGFLYKPHTLTALALVIGVLCYTAFYTGLDDTSTVFNTKLGLGVAVFFFLTLGLLIFPSGPFIRPHPLLWRFCFGLGVVYELCLIVLLFQNKSDARQLFTYFDPDLGKPLVDKSYAADCSVNWKTLSNSMDIFMFGHFFGWFMKSLMIRDMGVCWMISIQWELIEMALTHMLPNFAECWWDQWVLDVLLSNGLGIYCGYKMCNYLEMKEYHFTGFRDIPSLYGKAKRTVQQFTPSSWIQVRWESDKTIKRFLVVQLLILAFHIQELNAFWLKHILWFPPACPINFVRIGIWALIGVPSLRQIYSYLTDPKCKRLGHQCFMSIVILTTECLIVYKFGKGEFPAPMPDHVKVGCWIFAFLYALYCVGTIFKIHARQIEEREDEQTAVKSKAQ